jgi:hypothetical protein
MRRSKQMDKSELLVRVCDLYNYVQAVRNQLSQIDSAIARLTIDIKVMGKEEQAGAKI